jgi:hypothetical protein
MTSQVRRADAAEEIRPLVELCKAGRLFEVQAWIAAGKPVNPPLPSSKREHSKSPLEIAIDRGFHSLVEVLLQGGAYFETEGYKCPISTVLRMRRFDMVKLLVEHGGTPQSVDMAEVFDTWDPEIMEYFIEKGADVETGRPLARALSNRIRTALRVFKRYKDRFPSFQEQANIALRHHCKEGNIKWVSLMLWAGADPYAPGTEDYSEKGGPPPETRLSALGYAAVYGHLEVFDLKGVRLNVKHPSLQKVMSHADTAEGARIVQRLFAMGMEPNDQENGGCSAIQSLLEHMSWTFSLWSTREQKRGSIDTDEARQKMKAIHILAKHGAKWAPQDKGEVDGARRSLLKLKPDYTVEFVWIMSKYKACTLDSIQQLLSPSSSIRPHVFDHSQRVDELLASWS